MSNALAIATVTATLRHLVEKGLEAEGPGIQVTTRPPDKAREDGQQQTNRVNLFLYQTMSNGAWNNMDMPRQVKPGETGYPPLALNLCYLITAYGENDDDTRSHRLLGRVMSVLHDHPLLGRDEIKAALSDSGLHDQVERVRITPQPLSLEELSKLWTTFQTQYRISTAYQVAVVLIESTRPPKTPLPVLTRGSEDQGVSALASPSPTLTTVFPDVLPPESQPSARLGDNLVIAGQHLDSEGIVVRINSLRLPAPIEIEPLPGGTATRIRVHFRDTTEDPAAPTKWVPGFYTLALVVKRPNLPAWTTNEVAFALAPTITVAPTKAPAGDIELTVTCTPRLREGQHVMLLFGERQIPVKTISTPANPSLPNTLTFPVSAATAGTYLVRLRVDGVDSLPVVRTGIPPRLEFDLNQKVTVT